MAPTRRPDDLPQAAVAPSTLDHFSRIPLAQPTLRDPAFRAFPSSRAATHAGRGHTLTGKTWNSPDTIAELLSFYRPASSSSSPSSPSPEDLRAEVRRFYTLGPDLNAHPDLLHGGVVAALLDSTLGHAVAMTTSIPPPGGGGGGGEGGPAMFTAQLNVSFKRPVRTPGTVVVRAWVARREGEGGRKVWAQGVVEGEGGVLHARAEGLWVQASGGKGEVGARL